MSLNFSPFELAGRRALLLAPRELSTFGAKTAVCYLRYRTKDVAAVVDPECAGRTVEDVLGFGGDIPVVADVESALPMDIGIAIVGIAPQGGRLSDDLRSLVLSCAKAGIDVVSGLHDFVCEDSDIAEAAEANGARLWDVRMVPGNSIEQMVGTGLGCKTGAKTILTVGSDCNVGKMTATLELYNEAATRGLKASWAATGQTGMMLRERGIAIDRVIADFVSGAAEELVDYEGAGHEILFVEGQGSIVHPGYAGVMLGLMFGVMPDCMVMVHAPSRSKIGDSPYDMPDLVDLVRLYENVMSPLKKSPVVAVILNTAGFEEAKAHDMIERAQSETGLPVSDPVRFGLDAVLDGALKYLK